MATVVRRRRGALTAAAWLNAIGLICDIAGAVLLFRYGLPAEVSPLGRYDPVHETHVPDEAEAKKFKRYRFGSRIGLMLLVAGFALQLVGTVLPAFLPLLAKLTLPSAPVLVWL